MNRQRVDSFASLVIISVFAPVLAACDRATGPNEFAPTVSASVTGAIVDEFQVTLPMPSDTTPRNGNAYVRTTFTPGLVEVFGFRRRGAAHDILGFSIPNVRNTGEMQSDGTYLRHGSPARAFFLEVNVRVTRLTSKRLTGVFTAVGVEQNPPTAVPDTIHIANGSFDLPLEEPIPEP